MTFNLPSKVYDALKWVTMVLLPALAVFYVSLAEVFNLPMPEQVSATIAALIVFLGIFLQINSSAFKLHVALEYGRMVYHDVTLTFVMSNALYDSLKWISTILLPALATLYVAFSAIWGLPYGEEVAGSIAAVVMFMAALLQISSLEYKTSMTVLMGDQRPAYLNPRAFALSNEAYDVLKFVAQGLLPGVATFYFAIAAIWGLPYSEQVSATIMAVVVFMNALLQISTAKYNNMLQDIEPSG